MAVWTCGCLALVLTGTLLSMSLAPLWTHGLASSRCHLRPLLVGLFSSHLFSFFFHDDVASVANSDGRFFKDAAEVPRCALSAGISTIRDSRCVVLIATGAKKAEAIQKSIEGAFTSQCAAVSFYLWFLCPSHSVVYS